MLPRMLCRHWCYQSTRRCQVQLLISDLPLKLLLFLSYPTTSRSPPCKDYCSNTDHLGGHNSRLHWLKLNKLYTVKSLRLNSSIDGKPVDVCLLSLSTELYLDDMVYNFSTHLKWEEAGDKCRKAFERHIDISACAYVERSCDVCHVRHSLGISIVGQALCHLSTIRLYFRHHFHCY